MERVREIIFDTETTGLDPASGDRMVEIGCIEVMNRVPTGRTFHAYFNPERPMDAGALAVHGLTDTFLADKPRFAERAGDLIAFLGECPLVAHNAGFDLAFLNAELALSGLPGLPRERTVDTVALARVRHPGAKLSLDALCTRYGIDRSHRTRHGALLDAELLAQVYVELCGGRQIGLELVTGTIVGVVGNVVGHAVAALRHRVFRPARPHAASADERAAHAAFLQTVEAPIWSLAPTPALYTAGE